MRKMKISQKMFDLQKALCTGKAAKQVGIDTDGKPIFEIVEYDVEAALKEKFEIVEESELCLER